ncbi:sigma-70 family RNA polymerase sigma factor [Gemmata sp. JC673]|uniref:RNA polymerase sigma factor n=1 Tax=Gemmata algarum TaxID=2975278 RepID=A0ABU5F332_9BACT|nr:sigma-70 family RNA polymerase sigma factor [Gemmata algarum]MDY3561152.1 sigma-70 family RNA polymerase sigma factor [Gemmata algarum]
MTPTTDPTAEDRLPGADPGTWFERYGDYLYRFALARVRRAEAAEDLVQEALLAAWRNRAEFDGRSSERTWLTAILKRKAVDWLRKRVREQLREADGAADRFADDLFDRRGGWKTPPGLWGAVEPLDRAEFWATFRACLGKLPERMHTAFALRYLDEAAAGEVCRELGLTPSNLWVLLHRGRLRMWWCLSKNWFGEEPQEGDEP